MPTQFSEFQRLRAAIAVDRDRFCVAIHELEADDPFSIILEYDGSFPQPWSRVEVQRNVFCVTARAGAQPGDRPYVAISDEGDVFFIEDGGIRTEKIPGAGIYSDDADGSGGMAGLSSLGAGLVAFGMGGQLYERDSSGSWFRLIISNAQAGRLGSFSFLESYSGSALAGGRIEAEFWRTPEQIQKEMMETDDLERYHELSEEAERWAEGQGIVQTPVGLLLQSGGDDWQKVDVKTEQVLNAAFVEYRERIWIVGSGGLILVGNPRDGFQDQSFHGDRAQSHVSITKFRDRLVIASDYRLSWFDGHILTPLKPRLEPSINGGVPTPLKVQAVDDVLWLFDYKHGILRYDGENWEDIAIPPELLERNFQGLSRP
ncbi:hypothetical protein [Fulvimarina sp. MAC8]|uniref:hypothetical protein n=1 Tax=Fulvimarina sp. MAC8 TaxID=3162874 RepID=UPI0032F015A8